MYFLTSQKKSKKNVKLAKLSKKNCKNLLLSSKLHHWGHAVTWFFLSTISCISWLLELLTSSEDFRDFFFLDFNRNEDLRDFDLVITGFSVDCVDKLRFRVWVLVSVIALFLVSRCLKSNINQIQKLHILKCQNIRNVDRNGFSCYCWLNK